MKNYFYRYLILLIFVCVFNIYSIQYIDENIKNTKQNVPFFMVSYLLCNDGPQFSPDLNVNNSTHLFKLINSLLESITEMGSCMERIDNSQPSYYVVFYLLNF